MAPIIESQDSILPVRSMPAKPTSDMAHLQAWSFPASKAATEGAAPLTKGPKPPTQFSWEKHKPIMKRLYIDEERPLREVSEILEKQHGFKASPKMYKSRFRSWGWRKYIRLDPDVDAGRVQDVINSPEDTGDQWGRQVLLANGQVVDIERLHRHLRRKRRQNDSPLNISIKQPEIYYNSEIIFYSCRSHTLSEYSGKVKGVKDALELFAKEEPITGRWLRFTDGIRDLMQQQNLGEAVVQMRRAPEEVAIMVQTEPTALLSNLFLYILKLCNHPALTPAESKQVGLVAKSLLRYTASLFLSGPQGRQAPKPLQRIMNGIATAGEGDLREIAARAWLIILQSWAEIASLDPSSATSQGSLFQFLESGDQEDKDGLWFIKIIEGIVDGTVTKHEARYGKRDSRCIEALQSKAMLVTYTNMAKGLDFYRDPKLKDVYLQILTRGAQGAARAEAINFLAESHRIQRESDTAAADARSCAEPTDG